MLQNTYKEEKHALENYGSDEHVVRVELETNVGRSSSKDQQHYSIATGRHKRTIKPVQGMLLRIWFLMH